MGPEEGPVAFVDMEFGHVYGTHRQIVMPIEVGVVTYDPAADRAVFSGKTFAHDLEVEIWKSSTDDLGRRTGVVTTVANPGLGTGGLPYDPRFRLDRAGWRHAREAAAASFSDLACFMGDLCSRSDPETFTFFARSMECRALDRAGFDLGPYACTDLQCEVGAALGMKQFLSLDRAGCIIGFGNGAGAIRSNHYRYPVPDCYAPLLRPHRAVGDAARIFLLAREFYASRESFLENAGAYFLACGADEGGGTSPRPRA
jgi:hypothetical protein